MTLKEFIDDTILNLRVDLGLALYYPAAHLMINPACRLLALKTVTPMQLHSLIGRHDAERRYSRAGLELMLSFANTYLSDDKYPETCYPCIFSADGDLADTSVCRHEDAPKEGLLNNPDKYSPPEYCPLKKMKKQHEENIHGNNS